MRVSFQWFLSGLKEVVSTGFDQGLRLSPHFWRSFTFPSWNQQTPFSVWAGLSSRTCDRASPVCQSLIQSKLRQTEEKTARRNTPSRTCSPFYCRACCLGYCPPHEWLMTITLEEPAGENKYSLGILIQHTPQITFPHQKMEEVLAWSVWLFGEKI